MIQKNLFDMNIRRFGKLAAVILLITSASVTAQDKRVLLTPVKDERAVNVFVDLKEDIPYSVAIIDQKGYTVWTKTWNNSVFARSIVLDEVPNGSYKVRVSSNNRYFENSFTVENNDVQVSQGSNSIVAPTVSVMGQTVLVDFDQNGTKKDVEVKIYSRTGIEVFANNITTDAKRITRYDLSTLNPGSYAMVFTIEGKQFSRTVRIR